MKFRYVWLLLFSLAFVVDAMASGKVDSVCDGYFAQTVRLEAASGSVEAQRCLGFVYLTGYPFPSHLPSAVDYLTQAAGAGDARSQFQLGLLYLSGEGVERDVPKGVGLLEASIDKYSFDESGVRISTRPGEDVERLKSMAETTVEVVLPPAVVDLKFGTGR